MRLVWWAFAFAISSCLQWASAQEPANAFDRLDLDRDGLLIQTEFSRHEKEDAAAKNERDFRLFDFDHDGKLSRGEFSAVPVDSVRGSSDVPDPMVEILDRAMQALNDSFDNWQRRPDESVDCTMFIVNYLASLSLDGRRRLDRNLSSHADQNSDRKVSLQEAMLFLETQLGMKWITGDSLRLSNGRLVNFADFLETDLNGDNQLEFQEALISWPADTGRERFRQLNVNDDATVTLAEFASSLSSQVDPIMQFCAADTDFDGELDQDELVPAMGADRNHLIASNLRAFDFDQSGKLSLEEFRVSMLAHHNYPWDVVCKDVDGDDQLSFNEFEFSDRKLFHLQRRFFFHQLDSDADGALSISEFTFQRRKQYKLLRNSINGEESLDLFRDPKSPICRSPDVSADGEKILFDAMHPDRPLRSQIFLVKFNGEDAMPICDGRMPSWSPDGLQFACSRYEHGRSVWIMNLDGTEDFEIGDGWGAQWSPDGKSIAFTRGESLQLFDVESRKTRPLLGKGQHPFKAFPGTLAWSPDSKRVAFIGRLEEDFVLAIIHASGEPRLQQRLTQSENFAADLAWSPDGRHLLFDLTAEERKLIHQLDPDGTDAPRFVPETNGAHQSHSVCFSPDGGWLILASEK